jgi:hypothetical protein
MYTSNSASAGAMIGALPGFVYQLATFWPRSMQRGKRAGTYIGSRFALMGGQNVSPLCHKTAIQSYFPRSPAMTCWRGRKTMGRVHHSGRRRRLDGPRRLLLALIGCAIAGLIWF